MMSIGNTLRWLWAWLTGRATAPQKAFGAVALATEAMHIRRQLLRLPDSPVSDAERQWWRQHFGPPDGYLNARNEPDYGHMNMIDRQWRDHWGRFSPQAQAASWVDWERRGVAVRTTLGTYQATPEGGLTVLQEMWGNERT